MTDQTPEGDLALPARTVQIMDTFLERVAEAAGEMGGTMAAREQAMAKDYGQALADRDQATRLLGSLVKVLDGMGWAPSFAGDGKDVEEARDFLRDREKAGE